MDHDWISWGYQDPALGFGHYVPDGEHSIDDFQREGHIDKC